MGQKGWMSELTELDEFFGKEPRYPLATINEHLSYELHKQNEVLNRISFKDQELLINTTNQICGSIENGFTELYNVNSQGFNQIINAIEVGNNKIVGQLFEVNRNLEKIEATLHWGFSALINQLTITNSKLDEIIQLLNIPDSQKQRKYHLEQGFDFIKKSNVNSFFFSKSKENFEKAIQIEDSDYLSLQQLGIIHLYSKEELNLELSSKYFEKSILYSKADIGFAKNIENPSSFHFTYSPSKITATSMMHLARYYYKLEDYKSAFDTALKGSEVYELVSIFYDLSRYSSKLNRDTDAIKFLNKAISMDRYISVKALTESDLNNKPYILEYLQNLQSETTKIAAKNLSELKSLLHKNSVYKSKIDEIESLINKKEYLSSLKSLEIIGFELEN